MPRRMGCLLHPHPKNKQHLFMLSPFIFSYDMLDLLAINLFSSLLRPLAPHKRRNAPRNDEGGVTSPYRLPTLTKESHPKEGERFGGQIMKVGRAPSSFAEGVWGNQLWFLQRGVGQSPTKKKNRLSHHCGLMEASNNASQRSAI